MRLVSALYQRFQVIVHEMAKFGVVGAINTVVHFGLFNVLHLRYGWGPLTSNGIAIVVAATSSYFMNRHWTFRHRARTGAGREYSLFFLLNGVGWIISQACVAVTVYVLGLTGPIASNAALVVGVALGMGFRFATYKRWVFLPLEVTEEEAGEPAGALLTGPSSTTTTTTTTTGSANGAGNGAGVPGQSGSAAGRPAGKPAARARVGRSEGAEAARTGTGW